jgi:hypothetical protein
VRTLIIRSKSRRSERNLKITIPRNEDSGASAFNDEYILYMEKQSIYIYSMETINLEFET